MCSPPLPSLQDHNWELKSIVSIQPSRFLFFPFLFPFLPPLCDSHFYVMACGRRRYCHRFFLFFFLRQLLAWLRSTLPLSSRFISYWTIPPDDNDDDVSPYNSSSGYALVPFCYTTICDGSSWIGRGKSRSRASQRQSKNNRKFQLSKSKSSSEIRRRQKEIKRRKNSKRTSSTS